MHELAHGPEITTAATSYPVTLAQAMSYAGATEDADSMIDSILIPAATRYVQDKLGMQLITATLLQTWDDFPEELTLLRRPVSAVSWVKYYATDATLTTIDTADYFTSFKSRPPRIMPAVWTCWPVVQCRRPEAVQVQYVAGYANAAAVPGDIKIAILALIRHWHKYPDPVLLSGGVPQKVPFLIEDMIHANDETGYH